MNLRDAAALALVDWYLMMPPPYVSSESSLPPIAESTAPLREWNIWASSDDAATCQATVAMNRDKSARKCEQDNCMATGKSALEFLHYTQWLSAACIASDDGRLEGN